MAARARATPAPGAAHDAHDGAVEARTPVPGGDDRAVVARVLAGDAATIGSLVDRLYAPMAYVAGAILRDPGQVPDVVQDTWIRVLAGLRGFEFLASLKTWALHVAANCARTRAARAPRELPLGLDGDDDAAGATVPAERFGPLGSWRDPPAPWREPEAEASLIRKQRVAFLLGALDDLPASQRAVVRLRDVEELDGAEVASLLGISEVNQRVLLHRGRARLRAALERREREEARR